MGITAAEPPIMYVLPAGKLFRTYLADKVTGIPNVTEYEIKSTRDVMLGNPTSKHGLYWEFNVSGLRILVMEYDVREV